MKAGPLSCPQCGAQVWGVPPEFDYFFGRDPKAVEGAWVELGASCSKNHQLIVRVYPDKSATVESAKAVSP